MKEKKKLIEPFYQRLSYSFGNEDPETELRALSIQPSDTVCCVTASGDRPLNLLIKDCKKILSIDLNPIQNHLLALKIQAMQQLEHEDYLNFLGASIEPYPIAFTDTIIEALPDDAKAYWIENKKMIENGVLYEGALEKFCFGLAIFLNLLFKKEIDLLFNASDIFEQQKAIDLLLDRKLLKWMAKIILHPKLTKKYFSDPGLYAYVDSDITIHEHLIELIRSSLNIHLVKENPLLNLLFQGKVSNQALPPYLKKDGIKKIKSRLNKIEIVHANMVEFLESQPENSIDCFSFSDIASYMSCENFNRLIKAMIRCAKPKARFCIRELMSNHRIDEELSKKLLRDGELEAELKAIDKCFVYRFMVGEII